MTDREKEFGLVVGYIMYHDLLSERDLCNNYGHFDKIDKALDLAKYFIIMYPPDTNWEEEKLDWDEAIEDFVNKNR